MKRLTSLAAVLCLAALPLRAETAQEDGPSLMEQGARLFMEGLMREMEPAMKDLQGLADDMGPQLREFADTMGPALADILGRIEDLSAYHPPEMLPNGDILIRRKTPEEMADEPMDEGEIEI